MKRAKWMALAVAAGALVAEFAVSNLHVADAAPNPGRVIICHNTGNGNITIEVAASAVQKHISQHGDVVRPCVRPS